MEKLQPRYLRYRTHYRVYLLLMLMLSALVLGYWGYRLWINGWQGIYAQQSIELAFTGVFFALVLCTYIFWLRSRLNRSVQVFPDHLTVHRGKLTEEIFFKDIESICTIGWSLFYLKMKNDHKYYFNSGLERIDYVWEGLMSARPELLSPEEWEKFRVVLVQYDHHQKRKEWFFRHKLVDLVNWLFLPVIFLACAYMVQSREVIIHQQGLYFFRLFMYSFLVLLATSFLYSLLLKRLIFDRKVANQLESRPSDKLRDLEFEGVILQRSKIFQMVTACFVFALVIKTDLNLYSITKLRGNLSYFDLKAGKTTVVDNRFNCLSCRYKLTDGDVVMFGRGHVGQLLAREGELVGQVGQDEKGRLIASDNVQEVPEGHVAIKTANGKEIVFVKIGELIGKIQK